MRILFFSHYFPPEVNAPANRTHEHCREWVRAGHEVHVVTCIPSHPLGRPFAGFSRQWYRKDMVDGIHVHRVWTYLAPNKGLVRRTLNYLSFVPAAVCRALRLGSFDIAIGTSPQFFCAAATALYGRLRRTPWVFELRDLWPESIHAVGAMKGKTWALRLLESLEMKLYRESAAVVCVTEGFVRELASRGIPAEKLHFVPNGVVPSFWRSGLRDEERAALGIRSDQILACYVGTIGMAHGLGTLLQAARALRDTEPDIRFLIVGDGAELANMKARAAGMNLPNVTFTGLLPRTRVPAILAAADIALVTLKPSDVFKTVLPSKMFESMAAGRPTVLAVDGEARATLARAGAGVYVPPGDPTALAGAVKDLSRDAVRRQEMGQAAAEFVEREFGRRAWAERYVAILATLLKTTAGAPSLAAPVRLKDGS